MIKDQPAVSILPAVVEKKRPLSFPWVTLLMTASAIALLTGTLVQVADCPWPAVCGPILEDDLLQTRQNTALPPLQGNMTAEQTFTPRWNGLTEIELSAVRYGEPPGTGDGRLTAKLLNDQNTLIAEQSFSAQLTEHNQTLTLRFPPQPRSAGRLYRLQISGSSQSQLSLWGYSLDVYHEGQLSLNDDASTTAVQDLRFTTRYHLLWTDALRILGKTLLNEGALLLLALLFLPLPGILILLVARPSRWDTAAWCGVALALGVATWPLLWQWLTVIGGRWAAWSLWTVVLGGYISILAFVVTTLVVSERSSHGFQPQRLKSLLQTFFASLRLRSGHALRELLPITLLLLIALAVRFVAVRDLSFPPWVDSSRHALITAVMVNSGQTPTDYEPYLPVGRFAYHYGFHTLSASLSLLTGWPLPRLLLVLGQLLNGLTPLSLYAATWLITRRRGAALLAAFLVALPLFFPAYYATWGRMTQLAAVLVLPLLLALTWRIVEGQRHIWPLVAILAAGLFLIHFRVFLFYLPFAGLVTLFALVRRRPFPLLLAAGLGLLLTLPRLLELLQTTTPTQAFQHSIANYNDFPTGYITVGWERYFIAITAVALLFVLIAAVSGQRSAVGRRPSAVFPLILAAWVASLFLLLAGSRLGLPETSLVNTNSLVITLFVPQALFLAVVAGGLWRWLTSRDFLHRHRWLLHLVGVVVGMAVGFLALYGGRQQIDILNNNTLLAYHDDLPALEWAAANLPPDALVGDTLVAVNSWQWLGDTWAGSDGGAWLTPLTGLQTTAPPVDYVYDPDLLQFVSDFNEGAKSITDWSTPEAAAWLREQGITHIFIGAKGGFFDPAALATNPQMKMIYHQDGVFIFAIHPS